MNTPAWVLLLGPLAYSGVLSVAAGPSRDSNGPFVKTGPTAGQNRSRNKDGSWREKRSDTGTSRSKNDKPGCFLTTAACHYRGLPDDCHELQTLRSFRDRYLAHIPGGAELIERYYEVAPAI